MIFVLRTPAMAGVLAIAQSPAFTLFFVYLQAFSLPQPMQPLDVHTPAFLAQQHADATIAISWPAKCQPVHSDDQSSFFLADVDPVTLR